MTRTSRRAVLAFVFAGLVFVGLAQVYWVHVEHRLQTIAPGRLYQSAAMPPGDLVALARRLELRTVIDLRSGEQAAEIEQERLALEAAGVRHVHLPSRQLPERATRDAFLAETRRPEAWPALVHCQHGTGRSVLLSAIYRIEAEGWEPERARCATRWITFGSGFASGGSRGRYLMEYRSRDR